MSYLIVIFFKKLSAILNLWFFYKKMAAILNLNIVAMWQSCHSIVGIGTIIVFPLKNQLKICYNGIIIDIFLKQWPPFWISKMAAKTCLKKLEPSIFEFYVLKISRNCNKIALGTPISQNDIRIRTIMSGDTTSLY